MIIFAAPKTVEIETVGEGGDSRKVWAFDLQTAINRARAGDTIQLTPGRYISPVTICTSGKMGAPITLVGPEGGEAILDGCQSPQNGQNSGLEPLDGDFAFIKVFNEKRLIIRGLKFENNWPTSIYLRGASDIVIQDCDFLQGRYAIYARQGLFTKTQRILIERCTWLQDPEQKMWLGDVTWEQVKFQDPSHDASYFNGAFFGSFDITGNLTIRDCVVLHAFNAIRMDVRAKRIRPTAKEGPILSRNKNIAIYNNQFSFIRDNAIEPEAGAENWYVFDNQFFNIHGTFSFDLVACRNMFYVGNRILNNRKPEQGNTDRSGGVIFKFLGVPKSDGTPLLAQRKNLWSVFNSVQTRTSYVKKSRTMFWRDAYNAVGMYDSDYPDSTSNPRAAFNKFRWEDGDVIVRGIGTNDPGFPDGYPAENIEEEGFPKLSELFEIEDFQLAPELSLGGWNGELRRSPVLAKMSSSKLRISRTGGPDFLVSAGFSPGAHDAASLGLNFPKEVSLPKF